MQLIIFMKIISRYLLFFFFSISSINAQSYSIFGKISANKESVANVNVSLLNKLDSSIYKSFTPNETRPDFFRFLNVNIGNYILQIKADKFETYYQDISVLDTVGKQMLAIELTPKVKFEQNATVVIKAPIAKQNGDTSEYKSSAYKTNPDATAEDLITKMPGVNTSNGKVQAQGEDVKQVLVDGKPFFGEDPNAVLKNIPADMIDKVQVFDQKSAQTQFTGFDDGNTSKTINIITKQQFKNGIFGRSYVGYGNDDKYRAGTSINFFKDNRKISFLYNGNNVNEQNFSADDLLGVMSTQGNQGGMGGGMPGGGRPGGGGPRGGGGGGFGQNSSESFLVNNRNGIATTQAFGINYANKWKKVDFAASYFFNYSNTNTINNTFRTYITKQSSGLLYNENAIANNKNTNHRANFRIDWQIDTFNSLLFQPKISFQNNKTTQNTLGSNNLLGAELSGLNSFYQSLQNGYNLNSTILYRHIYKHKRGRTLSVNSTPGYNNNSSENTTISKNNYLDTLSNDTLNQMVNSERSGFTMNSNITFTEPLSKNTQLLINYTNNINVNQSDKKNNQYTPTESRYNTLDTQLSNTFKSSYIANGAGLSYAVKKDKLNFNVGTNFQVAQLKVDRSFPVVFDTTRTFYSLLPSAMVQYKFSNVKNIRLYYRSSNNAPSIDQLQDIINNGNPLQLTTGNKNLKQDFQNFLNIRYTSTNTKKNTTYFGMIGGSITRNYIANSTFIFQADSALENVFVGTGSQLSKPMNLQGYYALRSYHNYSFVIKKIKSNVNANLYANTTRTPSSINNVINYAQSSNAGAGLSLASNISKNLDFTISSNSTFSTISNTLQTNLNTNFFNQISKFKIQLMPWKGLVLQSDITHQLNQGLSKSINTNFTLWNAGMGYKFLKDKQAEFRLVVFDMLAQNTSITRNTTETYYEDVKSNILQRYFMLNFTYNIKYFKAKGSEKVKEG